MGNTKKICILSNTGLGNIILFIPAFTVLKREYPDAKFYIVQDKRWYHDSFFSKLFGNNSQFIFLPDYRKDTVAFLKTLLRLRKKKFDISLMPYCGISYNIALFLTLINAKKTVYFKTGKRLIDMFFNPCVDVIDGEHYINKNLRQVAQTVGEKCSFPKNQWVEVNNDSAKLIKKNENEIWVGIHPGVNTEFNESRQWPTPHFAELLVKMLAKSKVRAVLFGRGAKEKNIIHSLIKGRDRHCLSVIDCSLDIVSAYLSLCDVFVGNDSGLMNLAVGLGVPTVAILGPTDPRHTGPYGEKHKIARLELACSPCFDKGYSLHCKHRKCLTELSPDYVYGLMKEVLLEKTRN